MIFPCLLFFLFHFSSKRFPGRKNIFFNCKVSFQLSQKEKEKASSVVFFVLWMSTGLEQHTDLSFLIC